MKALPFGMVAGSLALTVLSGCAYAARSPEMYRDATQNVLEPRNEDILACYDSVLDVSPGASGKVTVTFEVETEQGKITNVRVDDTNTTAPPQVAECVTRNIRGLALSPPDERTGKGTWVYEFNAPPVPSSG